MEKPPHITPTMDSTLNLPAPTKPPIYHKKNSELAKGPLDDTKYQK